MKPITKTYLLLFTCLFLLAACQKEEDVPAPYTETVQLIISVPASASTRIGDPGTAVDEGADWNQLAVILAYTDDSQVTLPGGSNVQVTTISKTEFETFGKVLEKAQSRIQNANDELDKLIGVRTRQIQRKLKDVEKLETDLSQKILSTAELEIEEKE